MKNIKILLNKDPRVSDYGEPIKGKYFVEISKKYGRKITCFISFSNGKILFSDGYSLERIYAQAHRKKYTDFKPELDNPCTKCGGLGILPEYGHIDNGRCFRCHGTGNRTVKA